MEQKEVVKNKAGVDKELKLTNGWDITKRNNGEYMFSHLNVFLYGDKVLIKSNNPKNIWLNIYHLNTYIASIWIDSPEVIKELKEFIKDE